MNKKVASGILGGFVFLIFLIVILIETKPPETTEEFNYILWEEGQLTLNSFNVISTDPDDVVVAETNAGFEEPTYETQIVNTEPCEYGVVNYITKAHFNPESTWIDLEKAEEVGVPRVLNHEQRHFDIIEIYSRIINQGVLDLYSKIPCPDVDDISLESTIKEDARIKIMGTQGIIQNLVDTAQEYYENETNYGFDDTAQKKWDDKINACLLLGVNELDICMELQKITAQPIYQSGS